MWDALFQDIFNVKRIERYVYDSKNDFSRCIEERLEVTNRIMYVKVDHPI